VDNETFGRIFSSQSQKIIALLWCLY
jgi:hypothetical protein